jgi:hypothetical protein
MCQRLGDKPTVDMPYSSFVAAHVQRPLLILPAAIMRVAAMPPTFASCKKKTTRNLSVCKSIPQYRQWLAACTALPQESLARMRKELEASLVADESALLGHHLARILANLGEPSYLQQQRRAVVPGAKAGPQVLPAVRCLRDAGGAVSDALLAAAQRCVDASGANFAIHYKTFRLRNVTNLGCVKFDAEQ